MKQLVFILLIFACVISCKSTKTVIVDKSVVNDSIVVKTEVASDSLNAEHKQEATLITAEKEFASENTTIQFGKGGGTYNVLTGEATNVLAVSLSMEIDRLKEDVSFWQGEYKWIYTKLNLANDSIANLKRQMDIESKVEETYQVSWYWWMVVGALLMLVAIVVLRKIPQTSWLLFWI